MNPLWLCSLQTVACLGYECKRGKQGKAGGWACSSCATGEVRLERPALSPHSPWSAPRIPLLLAADPHAEIAVSNCFVNATIYEAFAV